MSWNDARTEQLKRDHADGLAASQIAKRLGGVTRNAVIGKLHRLGLTANKPSSEGRRQNGRLVSRGAAKRRPKFNFARPKPPPCTARDGSGGVRSSLLGR